MKCEHVATTTTSDNVRVTANVNDVEAQMALKDSDKVYSVKRGSMDSVTYTMTIPSATTPQISRVSFNVKGVSTVRVNFYKGSVSERNLWAVICRV